MCPAVAQGALAIDAPGAVTLAGALNGAAASWSLASSSIGLLPQGTTTDTLPINAATLAALGTLGTTRLEAGPVAFGQGGVQHDAEIA